MKSSAFNLDTDKRLDTKTYHTTRRRIGSRDEHSFCKLSTLRASTITLHHCSTFLEIMMQLLQSQTAKLMDIQL